MSMIKGIGSGFDTQMGGINYLIWGGSGVYSSNPMDRFALYKVAPPIPGHWKRFRKEQRAAWLGQAIAGKVKAVRNDPTILTAELGCVDVDERGADTPLDESGNTALHYAMNAARENDTRPAHLKAWTESTDLLDAVLFAGADPLVKNLAGKTALDLAESVEDVACLCYYAKTEARRVGGEASGSMHEKGSWQRLKFARALRRLRSNTVFNLISSGEAK